MVTWLDNHLLWFFSISNVWWFHITLVLFTLDMNFVACNDAILDMALLCTVSLIPFFLLVICFFLTDFPADTLFIFQITVCTAVVFCFTTSPVWVLFTSLLLCKFWSTTRFLTCFLFILFTSLLCESFLFTSPLYESPWFTSLCESF